MKTYNFRLVFIVVFCLTATLFSCRSVKPIEFKNIEDVKIENVNLGNTQMMASLTCYNPNGFGIKMISSNFDIYVNDKLCGNTTQTDLIEIKKCSIFSVPLNIDVNLKKAIANIGLGLLNQEVKITIKGKAKIKKGLISKDLSVTYTTKQRIFFL